MRGTVPGLVSPHPLGAMLPGLYLEANPLGAPEPATTAQEPFVQRFCAGLDEVLAPVFAVLDNLHAYIDPQLAPADFLRWLASWVGAESVMNGDDARLRGIVAEIVPLQAARGTLSALRRILELITGAKVEVSDNGGVSWAQAPGGELPGASRPALLVRVINGGSEVALIREVVEAWKPAHIPCDVEVVSG